MIRIESGKERIGFTFYFKGRLFGGLIDGSFLRVEKDEKDGCLFLEKVDNWSSSRRMREAKEGVIIKVENPDGRRWQLAGRIKNGRGGRKSPPVSIRLIPEDGRESGIFAGVIDPERQETRVGTALRAGDRIIIRNTGKGKNLVVTSVVRL